MNQTKLTENAVQSCNWAARAAAADDDTLIVIRVILGHGLLGFYAACGHSSKNGGRTEFAQSLRAAFASGTAGPPTFSTLHASGGDRDRPTTSIELGTGSAVFKGNALSMTHCEAGAAVDVAVSIVLHQVDGRADRETELEC